MGLNSKKEKINAGIALTGLVLFILGLVAFKDGIVTFNDWLFWIPLTIGIAEVIWFVSNLKPSAAGKTGVKCVRCNKKFTSKHRSDRYIYFTFCDKKKNGKDVDCEIVPDTRTIIKGENVFWFTAKWKLILLFVSAFISSGVLYGKKLLEEHYATLGLILIVVAVIFVFVWLNTLKFRKNKEEGM